MAKHKSMGKVVGLVALGGAALGGALFAVKRALGRVPGQVKGASGASWYTESLGQQGPSTLSYGFRVYLVPPAEKGKAAPGGMIPVLEYVQLQPRAGMTTAEMLANKLGRNATKLFDPNATAMNTAAIQDLGIIATLGTVSYNTNLQAKAS